MEHKSTTLIPKNFSGNESSFSSVNQENSDSCSNHTILLEIKQILITYSIAEAVKKKGGSTRGLGIKKYPGFQGFPLTRMSSIMNAFINCKNLPPIKVKQYRQSKYFYIVDGRHRFATNIILNSTHILCEIVR